MPVPVSHVTAWRYAMRIYTLMVVIAASLVGGAYLFAADTEQAKKAEEELRKLEQDWADAVQPRDAAKVEQILADDWHGVNATGETRTKKMALDQLRSGDLISESIELMDVNVRTYDESAVVTGKEFVKGRYKGKDINGEYRCIDVFVRKDDRWQCVASQITRIQ
jgi:ketosteroid isomerase-like protein